MPWHHKRRISHAERQEVVMFPFLKHSFAVPQHSSVQGGEQRLCVNNDDVDINEKQGGKNGKNNNIADKIIIICIIKYPHPSFIDTSISSWSQDHPHTKEKKIFLELDSPSEEFRSDVDHCLSTV